MHTEGQYHNIIYDSHKQWIRNEQTAQVRVMLHLCIKIAMQSLSQRMNKSTCWLN